MSGEPYPGLNPDDANDRNLAPVQALLKVWDGAQGGGRNWQPVYLYREAITGNFAARVHDTDLEAALLAGMGPAEVEFDGGSVACPAAASTVVFNVGAPAHDFSPYRFLVCRVENEGANPFADCRGYSVNVAGNYPATSWISTASVNGASAGHYREYVTNYLGSAYGPEPRLSRFLRVNIVSTLGTTVRCRVRCWK